MSSKVFIPGEVLAAADVNAYLLNRPLQNYIVNGGFDIFQRGDTTEVLSASSFFPADRWNARRTSFFGSGVTFTRTANPGVQGINNSLRSRRNTGTTATNGVELFHSLEIRDSVQLQGETVTLSFYARKGADYSVIGSNLTVGVFTGTGTTSDRPLRDGFTNQAQPMSLTAALTTDWARFTVTGTLASGINQVGLLFASGAFVGTAGANDWFEITGVQLQIGALATTFKRSSPTLQGELAACQRYYFRHSSSSAAIANGASSGTTTSLFVIPCPVELRTNPSSLDFSTLTVSNLTSYTNLVTNLIIQAGGTLAIRVTATATGQTTNQPTQLATGSGGFLGFSAEL